MAMIELRKEIVRIADQMSAVRECLQELLRTTTELRQRIGGEEAWHKGPSEVKWNERPSAPPPPPKE